MTRPSSNLDKKMIEAGIEVLAEEGDKGLTLRNICKTAGVNPGMFHYHFKNKENFTNIVYKTLNDKFMKELDFESVKNESSIVKLRYIMLKTAESVRKNQKLSLSIFRDSINDHDEYIRKIEKGLFPGYDYTFSLIDKAKEEGLITNELPTTQVYILLLFGALTPEFFADKICYTMSDEQKRKEKAGESFYEKRIDIILKGLEV